MPKSVRTDGINYHQNGKAFKASKGIASRYPKEKHDRSETNFQHCLRFWTLQRK